MNFDSLLTIAKTDYSKFSEIQSEIKSSNLTPAQLQEIYLVAVKANKDAIKLVPTSVLDEKICIAAIQQDIKNFEYIPSILRTKNVCREAIKLSSIVLISLKKPDDRLGLTENEYEELLIEAVDTHGVDALHRISSKRRNYNLCLRALDKDVDTLRCLEDEDDRKGLTEQEFKQICLEAVKKYGVRVLDIVPPDMLTYEFYVASLDYHLETMKYLQENNILSKLGEDKCKDIVNLASEKYGPEKVIEYVPTKMQESLRDKINNPKEKLSALTTEKYNEWFGVINGDPRKLTELKSPENRKGLTPDEYEKLCLQAIKARGADALDDILPGMRTYTLYLASLEKDRFTFKHMTKPEDRAGLSIDEEIALCLRALDIYGHFVLGDIPPKMRNYKVVIEAVNKGAYALEFIRNLNDQSALTDKEYIDVISMAKNKYGVKNIFRYLPAEMKTYEVCLEAANGDVNILEYLKEPNDRKALTSEQYADLCLMVIKKLLGRHINLEGEDDDALAKLIAHYESVKSANKLKKMPDIGTFFSSKIMPISAIYTLLGKRTFILMEKMLVTSSDNLYRFLSSSKLHELYQQEVFKSCSKNIARLFDEIEHNNANKKASCLKLYLSLSNEERQGINKLLDDDKTDIKIIPDEMRRLLIKRFFDYLQLPYQEKNALKQLSDERLTDLGGLFEEMKQHANRDKGKIFFSMLKMYLGGIPFEALHQPDEMRNGDDYMVKMAEHNKKLRENLANHGIDINKTYAYKEQTPLVFDEHQTQKILDILSIIYEKILAIIKDENLPNAAKKDANNLIYQLEKGKEKDVRNMLRGGNFDLLVKIANSFPDLIKGDYLKLTELNVSKNYTLKEPRKFHIEMWDKSKIETLFLGDYLSCCLATTGSQRTEYAPRVFDDAFLMPVIIDEKTKLPVCGAWLFMGEASQADNKETIDTIANFLEINAGLAENKALMSFLVTNLLNYIGQFSHSIHADKFMMRPLTYGMIPTFSEFGKFSQTHNYTVGKAGGYFGAEKYFLIAANEATYFYQFDPEKFTKEMKAHIASQPEPKTPGIIPEATMGFFQRGKKTSSNPSPDPDAGPRL